MGAAAVVCYKPKTQVISREDILKALNDKIIKESISPMISNSASQTEVLSMTKGEKGESQTVSAGITQDNTKATSAMMIKNTEDQRNENVRGLRQRINRGGRLTPHLQMDTAGDQSMSMNKTQQFGHTSLISTFNLMATIQKNKQNGDLTQLEVPSSRNPILSPGAYTKIQVNQIVNDQDQDRLQVKILSYFGSRDKVYDTLTQLSRQSLFFLRLNKDKMERQISSHSNDKARLLHVKSIEEHQSGVNQIVKLSPKEVVTASDDCYIKYWSMVSAPPKNPSHQTSQASLKADVSIPTETITCLAASGGTIMSNYGGLKREYLLAGCHSGNLLIINNASVKAGVQPQLIKKEQINNAHYNLIRVIVSLETLKNRYFVTADVCGIIKVWTSTFKPLQVLELDLEQAMSYNSLIELQNVFPKNDPIFSEAAMIACALKSQKIHIIAVMPGISQYQRIRTITTCQQKPTCLIQLSSKHIAVAVGSLREPSKIEIHDINRSKDGSSLVSVLSHHSDMIDSLVKVTLPAPLEKSPSSEVRGSYVQWLVSASRDRHLVLWKLYDGQPMRRSQANLQQSMRKQSQHNINNSQLLLSGRMSAEDYLRNRSFLTQNQQQVQQQKHKSQKSGSHAVINSQDDDSDDDNDLDGELSSPLDSPHIDADNIPLIKRNNKEAEMTQKNEFKQQRKKSKQKIVQKEKEEQKKEQDKQESCSEYGDEYESEVDSQVREVMEQASRREWEQIDNSPLLDYFYTVDSGHKDFVRSMIQTNDEHTLITASEDKTIKLFTLTASII